MRYRRWISPCVSIPPRKAVHKPPRRALICKMPSSSTVVADHQGPHAVPAHVAHLLAVPTHDISVTTTAGSPTPTSVSHSMGFRACPGNMPRYVAEVADWVIRAVSGNVACLPTIVACLLVGAVGSNVTLLVAVITQLQVTRRQCWCSALPCTMPRFTTGVADALIGATVSHMTRLSTVPT